MSLDLFITMPTYLTSFLFEIESCVKVHKRTLKVPFKWFKFKLFDTLGWPWMHSQLLNTGCSIAKLRLNFAYFLHLKKVHEHNSFAPRKASTIPNLNKPFNTIWGNLAILRVLRNSGLFKVNLEFSFSFPGFLFSGLDLVFKLGFQTWDSLHISIPVLTYFSAIADC